MMSDRNAAKTTPLSLDAEPMTPESISRRHSMEELVGQFVLSRTQSALPWQRDSLSGWHLAVENKLPFVRIRCEDQPAGWLLGHAIGPDGTLVEDELHLHTDQLEEAIYEHGGRFLVILPLLGRVYLDPCGLLGAVYCEHAGLVASSLSLIPYDEHTQDRAELIQAMGIPFNDAMYPVGMTPRYGIERILPNHYLDLHSWQTTRHWPVEGFPTVKNVPAAVAEITEITRRQLRTVVQQGPVMMHLTAGKDSRMLLACAKDFVQQIDYTTADFKDNTSKTDCVTAKKLAEIAGVQHRVLKWMDPEEADLDLWLHRTGMCSGEYRGWRASTMYKHQIDPYRPRIFGNVGDIARGIFWRPNDTATTVITAERLLEHCGGCASTPETLEQLNKWLQTAIAQDSLQLLDLFYLEQRLGCWAGIWTYAEADFCGYPALPYSHRRLMELMISLPHKYRRDGTLAQDVVSREWPELMQFPFATSTPPRFFINKNRFRFLKKIFRIFREPSWALTRLFHLFHI